MQVKVVKAIAPHLALLGLTIGAFGCSQETATNTPSSPEAVATPAANTTQSAGNAIKVAFPSRSDSTDLQNKANAVAAYLSKEIGSPVEAVVGDDSAAVEALRANQADVAFLSSRPALKAEQLAGANLYLAEVRPTYSGKQTYNSVFVVPKDSPLQSKGSAKETLQQLKGKKMAFTSPTSGSGFIFPVSELVKQGFVPNRDKLDGFFGQVSYGGNYSKALQAVLRGQAEVAAVSEYALQPPYITAEEGKKLRVLHAIPNVPAHGIAIDDDVPAEKREKIISALLKLNQKDNNKLLSDLYNSTELVKVEHKSHLQGMREALKTVAIDP
ncbi:phosphonate ABC transporter, periplasmic phosphonate-binding protein [Rivularia sp. IAM M-261]|nr:phosphonate ABC transporter, periplasmic phosphonate-binding protein [Rivularia sp. IAM M-261]